MNFILIASTPESIIPFRGKLIRELCNRGFNVHVCAPFTNNDNNVIRELVDIYCVNTHTIQLNKASTNLISDFRYFMGLMAVIKKVNPDMMLCYTMKPVIYGSIAGWVNKVPARYSMITGLGFLFIESQGIVKRSIQFIGKVMLSVSIKKNHKLFFQNFDDRNFFIEENLIGKRQVSIVTNGSGVDLEFYNVRPLPCDPSFLLIARMIKNKGIIEYIEAIREVKKSYPLVRFSLVGGLEKNIDGIPLDNIQSWVSEGLVDYKGSLSDVRPEIEQCSVYVLPSYREGTPRSVLEAMSMGRPIITTDVPGCRDTVIDGVTGLLVTSKNSTELANAMKRLIEDRELREAMGQKSREYAVTKYSDDSVVADMISNLVL